MMLLSSLSSTPGSCRATHRSRAACNTSLVAPPGSCQAQQHRSRSARSAVQRSIGALEPPTATLRSSGGHVPALDVTSQQSLRPVSGRGSNAATPHVGLATATANGLHEKNEDAAVIARLLRGAASSSSSSSNSNSDEPHDLSGYGSEGGGRHRNISISFALSGAGLKNDDPQVHVPRNGAKAVASLVRVSRIAGGGAADGATVVAHLAGVMDGHGGRGTAKWASRRLPHLVAEHFERDPNCDLTTALSGALRSFDRWWSDAMHDPSISRYGHDDSGSTAILALVSPAASPDGGWRLAVANLGDSRALLVSANHSVRQLSEMHNTGNPAELERLLAAGAQVVHPQQAGMGAAGAPRGPAAAGWPIMADGHARFFTKGPIWGKRGLKVSRALGDIQFKRPAQLVSTEPHCMELLVSPGDDHVMLLLLSDGVTDVLTDRQIADMALAAISDGDGQRLGLRHDEAAQAAAAAVVGAAAAHDLAHDNMTCACIVFE